MAYFVSSKSGDSDPAALDRLEGRSVVHTAAGYGAVNFNTLLTRPKLPDDMHLDTKYYIDMRSDDAFTRALKTVNEAVEQRINSNPDLQKLLNKSSWNTNDRKAWEKGISGIVSEEFDKIPGLGDYRTISGSSVTNPALTGSRNTSRLNDLSVDITNKTKTMRFDCGIMSFIEGRAIQSAENKVLPAHGKIPASYFLSGGTAQLGNARGGHVFIISSATGNIIEGTADPSTSGNNAYVETGDNYTFRDFINGQKFVGNQGNIYDSTWSRNMASQATAGEGAVAGAASKRQFALKELVALSDRPGTNVLNYAGEGFVVVAQRKGTQESIKVYKLDGSEGKAAYALVAEGKEKTGYFDPLTEKTYKFSVGKGKDGPEIEISQGLGTLASTDEARKVAGKPPAIPHRAAPPPGRKPMEERRTPKPEERPPALQETGTHAKKSQERPPAVPKAADPKPAEADKRHGEKLARPQELEIAKTPKNPEPQARPQEGVADGQNSMRVLQKGLGLPETGKWDGITNEKFAQLVAEVQKTDAYKKTFADTYGVDPKTVTSDLLPGPATFKAIQELKLASPAVLQAMKDLNLHDNNTHNDSYEAGDVDMERLAKNIQSDPILKLPAPLPVSATPGGPLPAPANR